MKVSDLSVGSSTEEAPVAVTFVTDDAVVTVELTRDQAASLQSQLSNAIVAYDDGDWGVVQSHNPSEGEPGYVDVSGSIDMRASPKV